MENKMNTLEDLVRIIRILRSENGCPWDRVQTHASIRMDMLEEAYEAADAIDKKDMKNLCEELGDVLMQVVFHAEIETEQGGFTMGDVIQGICEKMIYRHPHVFGSGKADTAEEGLINWEELKKKEKRQETQTVVMQSVPEALPALIRARKVQKKAADVGFDFPVTADAMRKVYEEVQELEQAVRENGEIEELVGIDDKLKLRTGHGAFELGKWSHIALVVDCSKGKDDYNEKYKLYVNGKQVKWDDSRKTDMDYSEIDLCAGNDGGRVSIGRASDNRRFLDGAILEARIWTVCRTEEQLKANAWELHEQNPEGLLGRWDFSAGAPTSYIEDGTNSDHELLMHISKYDSWNATEFPMSRFGEAPIEVPFK